jgi:O-6-methylguanine DNA methyltransferase
MEQIFWTIATTPWTDLLVASGARGLMAVHFVSGGRAEEVVGKLQAAFPGERFAESRRANQRAIEELDSYAAGELKKFTVPLDLRGTPFQLAVWRALVEIPYGQTRTYAEIARAARRPRAFRAVGLANQSNPIAIIVPCHRVIGSDGRLVGYGGGLELKRALIEHERRHAPTHSTGRGRSSLSLWE